MDRDSNHHLIRDHPLLHAGPFRIFGHSQKPSSREGWPPVRSASMGHQSRTIGIGYKIISAGLRLESSLDTAQTKTTRFGAGPLEVLRQTGYLAAFNFWLSL